MDDYFDEWIPPQYVRRLARAASITRLGRLTTEEMQDVIYTFVRRAVASPSTSSLISPPGELATVFNPDLFDRLIGAAIMHDSGDLACDYTVRRTIQAAAEAFAVDVFVDALVCAQHRTGVVDASVEPRDVHVARRIRCHVLRIDDW